MDAVIALTACLYLASTAAYFAYLFKRKSNFNRVGLGALVGGFVTHSGAILYAVISTGQVPATNLYETLIVAGWAIVCVFIVIQYRYRLSVLGIYAAPLAAIIMTAAYQVPRQPVEIKSVFNSMWLLAHILSIFIGEAALALACGVALLYLLQENAIKNKQRGFFYDRLPSLDRLDATGYACIVVGFTMLTLGLITGVVYAKTVWGRFWSWDPKEVWSAITWLLYAALLHQRLTVGWQGRRAAIMAIIGFAVVLFTFFGVNFLLQGHHGEFTRF